MKKYAFILMFIMVAVAFWQCEKVHFEPVSPEMAAELALLPEPSIGMGYINVASLQKSPFFSLMMEQWEKKPFHSQEYQEFMEATGLDVREDIHEIYFSAVSDDIEEKSAALLLIKGAFDSQKIMNYIAEHNKENKIEQETYKNFQIYHIEKENAGFSFIGENKVVVGTEQLVKKWLEDFQEGKGTKDKSAVLERIKNIKYKSGAWFTVTTEKIIQKMMEEIEQHPESRRFSGLKNIKNLNFSMKAKETLKFYGIGNFSDAEKAEMFENVVKGFLATIKLSMSEDRNAVDVMNKINVSSRGEQVLMDFEMTMEDIEKLKSHEKKIALR
jgi:hypothetical protein